MTEASDKIEQEAAHWLIRIDAEGTPERWRDLDIWLAQSPRHRAAFLRLSAGWLSADKMRAFRPLEGGIDREVLSAEAVRARYAPPRKSTLFPQLRPAWTIELAAAAGVAAIALGLALAYALPKFSSQSYVTQIGAVKHLSLNDGSIVDLNTNSEIKVRYTLWSRDITLLRGEAAFKVEHQRNRPFEVAAGATTVRVLGTAFSVRLHDAQHVDVHVTEGRVAINSPAPNVLAAGQEALIAAADTRINDVPIEMLSNRLSWTKGRVFFNGDTLLEAVTEFNRYNRRQLVIADPKIAGRRISGTFEATDLNKFVTTLKAWPWEIETLPASRGDPGTIQLIGKRTQ